MLLGLIIWPALVLLAVIGLYAIAPRDCRGLYLLPVSRTVAMTTATAAFVVWLFHL